MKSRIVLFLLFCWMLPVFAADPMSPLVPKAGKRLKVACVGDSITQGSGAAPGRSYPSQLQDLLGKDWEVGNFGVSGRTLLKKGDFPYWNEKAFEAAKEFRPDAVVIMLGTNDTKPQNWKHKDEFEGDYRELVKTFQGDFDALGKGGQGGKSSPRIYICRPVPVPGQGNFGINEKALQEQMPILARLSDELKTGTIDMYAALEGKPELLPDRVHPNTEGAGEMARAAYQVLTGKAAPVTTHVNELFQDYAVLQRDVEVPVWGTAPDGTDISVSFSGQNVTTTASDGRWMVKLKPMAANMKPEIMTIKGTSTFEIKELVVGDVWLASGQSNMERQLSPRKGHRGIPGWEQMVKNVNIPLVREFKVAKKFNEKPQDVAIGKWNMATPVNVGNFSGVAFFFAKELHANMQVPIGIINSSWGGTRVEAWLPERSLNKLGMKPELVKNQNSPGALFNGMIAPLYPFPFKGVIWYQGESNRGNPEKYADRFTTMVQDWRAIWNAPDMPFLYVQIAPHKTIVPELREAQLMALGRLEHAAMVVTTDVGDAEDIHPVQKEPVGRRLALAAGVIAYGSKHEYSGPIYQDVKFSGNQAGIIFKHAEGGLKSLNGRPRGFTIAGEDGVFVPARAVIRGSHVIVSSDKVPEPKAVRYGWSNVPKLNLFNQAGLPASPFRTDVK